MLEENLERWKDKLIAEARAQGIEQGEAKGIAIGEAEGMAIGQLKGARVSLLKILEFRFGIIPDNLISIISNMTDYNLLCRLQTAALTPGSTLQVLIDLIPRDQAKYK